MLLIRTNTLITNVEGKIQKKTFQKDGMLAPGHEMPEMNSSRSEVNT